MSETYLDDSALQARLTTMGDRMGEDVVTRALSRDVQLPHGAGTCVLITLDNGEDHRRPNTLGPISLAYLSDALDAARGRDDIAAIAVTGKPYFLAAGADLAGIAKVTDASDAAGIAQMGHGVFALLHDAGVPTFGFINGLALGGGLEVALNCDYRTVSTAAAAVGLPECFLGLIPGWGGSYLLPRLIGPAAAVQVMVTNPMSQNKLLTGAQAAALGIADVAFEPADYLARSLDWAAQVITGKVVVDRVDHTTDEAAWAEAVSQGRALVGSRFAGAAPAFERALDLIEGARLRDRVTGFRAEDDALVDLVMGQPLRAGLYAFNLTQRRAKKPAGAPDPALARPVLRAGVVGAGLMATQVALLLLRRLQVPVVISDVDQTRVDQGLARIQDEIAKLRDQGRVSADRANRLAGLISGTTDLAGFAACDLVIEAVFEELAVKQQVFTALERHVSEHCVLATNTSSLSVTAMAATLTHPERVVGFHFFNPVAVLPLVEIVRAEHTDDATVATAFALARQVGKNAVGTKDATAFVVNRVLVRMLGEITRVIDEGTPIEVADGAVRGLGLPMSPMALLALVGPGVALHVAESLHASFGDRFYVSPNVARLVQAGLPGVFSADAAGRPQVDPRVVELFQVQDRPSTAEQVRDRVEQGLAEEIGLLLAERVVDSPMDVDLCLILGAGWPFHLGGITPYLDRTGVAERVNGQRFLPRGVATLP